MKLFHQLNPKIKQNEIKTAIYRPKNLGKRCSTAQTKMAAAE
jgi:hypothetical protein